MSVSAPEAAESETGRPVPSRRPLVAGSAAGLWALLVGVTVVTCVVLAAWALAPNAGGDGAAAWRAAGILWLGAHLVPIDVASGELSLLPAGALLLGLLLNRRGGRWAGRLLFDPTPAEMVGIVTGGALTYGAGAAAVAWLSAGGSVQAHPLEALAMSALVALAGLAWGLAAETGVVRGVAGWLSSAARRTVMAGVVAVGGLLTTGLALVAICLVAGGRQAAETLSELDAGLVGSFVLTVGGVLCLPTLAVWAMSVVVGPGFDFGALGGLDITGGGFSGLPAVPVLAAIPNGLPGWAPGLVLVPVLMGVVAGRLRWERDLPTLSGALHAAAGVAGVVAALVGGLALLASGSLGGGRLAHVGPSALSVPAAAAGLVAVGFLAEAAYQSLRLTWDLYLSEQRAAGGLGGTEAEADVELPAAATELDRSASGGSSEVAAELAAEALAVAVSEATAPGDADTVAIVPVVGDWPAEDAGVGEPLASAEPPAGDGLPAAARGAGDAADEASACDEAGCAAANGAVAEHEPVDVSGDALAGSPPAEDQPAQDPPAEDPPAEDPPAQDPPAEDPPAEDARTSRVDSRGPDVPEE